MIVVLLQQGSKRSAVQISIQIMRSSRLSCTTLNSGAFNSYDSHNQTSEDDETPLRKAKIFPGQWPCFVKTSHDSKIYKNSSNMLLGNRRSRWRGTGTNAKPRGVKSQSWQYFLVSPLLIPPSCTTILTPDWLVLLICLRHPTYCFAPRSTNTPSYNRVSLVGISGPQRFGISAQALRRSTRQAPPAGGEAAAQVLGTY